MQYLVQTIRDLETLQGETYILAVIVAIVALALSYLVALLIAYEGGKNPGDATKRRVGFFIIGFVSVATFFLYNVTVVYRRVAPSLESRFATTNVIATVVVLVIFFVGGFILSKLLKRSKYGTIFPSRNK